MLRLVEVDRDPAVVAGAPVVGVVERLDGEAVGDRPGGEHVAKLQGRISRCLPVGRAVERRRCAGRSGAGRYRSSASRSSAGFGGSSPALSLTTRPPTQQRPSRSARRLAAWRSRPRAWPGCRSPTLTAPARSHSRPAPAQPRRDWRYGRPRGHRSIACVPRAQAPHQAWQPPQQVAYTPPEAGRYRPARDTHARNHSSPACALEQALLKAPTAPEEAREWREANPLPSPLAPAPQAAPPPASPPPDPPPAAPGRSFGNGSYEVGRDIQPGTYRSLGPSRFRLPALLVREAENRRGQHLRHRRGDRPAGHPGGAGDREHRPHRWRGSSPKAANRGSQGDGCNFTRGAPLSDTAGPHPPPAT